MKGFLKDIILRFSFLVIITLACCPVFAQEKESYPYNEFKPFKMVFLPDIHLSFEEKQDKILFLESMVIFQDVVKNLNKTTSPDFVVFGGNLTHNSDGQLTDMPMFLDIASGLKAEYYAIFGDREADLDKDMTKEIFAGEFDGFDYENQKQTFWSAEPVNGVLLIGMDSTVMNKKSGYVNIHQLFWLDNVLKNNRDKFTIIAIHHPPVSTTDIDKTKWKDYTLEKPDLFLELINLYPQVKIVLSGHHFNNSIKNINEKLFINCPSIVVYPNIYKVLEIYPDRVEIKNKKISFKQIIDKAKKNMLNSTYAKEFCPKKPEKVLKFQAGDKFSRKKEYYFREKKSRFLWF